MEDGEACWILSTWYMGPETKFKVVSPSSSSLEDQVDLVVLRGNAGTD
jgi:hypothetical protein